MALRLDNFEQAVEPVIVKRGKSYFRSGCVVQFSDEDGEVKAVVIGSDRYKVSMTIDRNGVIHEHRCNCPYDWGNVCKHEVAVLYYLREQRKKALHKRQVTDIIAEMMEPKKPLWEEVMDELLEPLQTDQPAQEEHPHKERLVYVIEKDGDQYRIHPNKQKWLKSNRWGTPTSAALKPLAEKGYDFMDEYDRAIAEEIRGIMRDSYYYTYYDRKFEQLENYLPHLIDTDKVYLHRLRDHTFLPVSVRKERAYLNIEKKGNKLAFSSNVVLDDTNSLQSVNLIRESKTSYFVIELTPYEQKVYSALLRLGSMPVEAEPKLRQFMDSIGSRLEIHSDMIEGGSTLEKVDGDPTILFRISPKHGAFEVELCVQPLQGGKLRFFPTEGKKTIFDEKDGVRYQVARDMQEEARRLEIINEFAAEEMNLTFASGIQETEIDGVLAIMDFVSLHTVEGQEPPYAVEWLEGAHITVKQPDTKTYSMGLRTKQNWFELEGELPVDEQTILSAAELLRLMQAGMVGKRFIRLGETEFLALNEQLTKQMTRVAQLAHISKNKAFIPRYAVGLLGELMTDPATVLRDDKGVRELLKRIDEANRKTFDIPKALQATLRDYQEEGYRWMMRLGEWGAGACLADDMGLGKTVQTIAVLLQRAPKGPSLVVAPASVLYNWQSEIARFAPTVNVHICNDAYDRPELIRSLKAYDILLTTYGLLVREEEALTEQAWNVVCLDEAHTIKNRQTKMSQAAMCLQAQMRIALTGTPLQNYLSELWNLFQFVNPGLLGTYEAFTHDFITPIEVEHNKQRQVLLRKILQPFLLRRTKAEVIDELPEKTEIIRRVELSTDERVSYEALRIEAQRQVEQADKVDMNVLAYITRLRQAADSDSKLEDFAELVTQIVTGGNRVLVFSQFTSFLKQAQNSLTSNSVSGLTSNSTSGLTFNSAGGLTSNSVSGLTSFYLDGSTPLAKRNRMVEAFQHGEAQVFFISLKAGGLGLNLTGANYVIHLDPWWNPAIEQQATDRAYRIGQQRNVTVYHLIAADTIEEKILRLHKTKRDLADALLQDQSTAHTLTLADLKSLLSSRRE